MPRVARPFEVLERINDNAYKVYLLGDYGVSSTFNVAYLSTYLQDDYLADLRSNSSKQEKNDGDPRSQPNLEVKVNQGNPCLLAKAQEMTHTLLGPKPEGPGFKSVQQPSFVYNIT